MSILQNPKKNSRDEAIKIFSSDVKENICDALVSIVYFDTDWRWCQSQCLTFLKNNDNDIRGLAATCLGHIARIHHKLDVELVVKELKKYLNDEEICGQVQDALDDIDIFIKDK